MRSLKALVIGLVIITILVVGFFYFRGEKSSGPLSVERWVVPNYETCAKRYPLIPKYSDDRAFIHGDRGESVSLPIVVTHYAESCDGGYGLILYKVNDLQQIVIHDLSRLW